MPARRFLTVALVMAATAVLAVPARAADVTVFAAASLKNALDDIAARYRDATGRAVRISYGASSTLARQIEQAAPADIFFSADVDWMDALQSKGLLQPGTRTPLLGNAIVLIAPRQSTANVAIAQGANLIPLLGKNGRLAMANVEAVPAGRYGKAALVFLGAWAALSPRLVQADNVRSALAFVARGEAPLGIVYATDANAEPAVKVIGTFPPDSHPPIVFPVALLAGSKNPDARAFYDFLTSDTAQQAFLKQGFTVLGPGS